MANGMPHNIFPAINASLNGLSAVFLAAGFVFIKKKNIPAHRACMISAFITSALFLACYLSYHIFVHHITIFKNPAWFRPIYLAILGTHTILAVVIVPMIIITLSRALREKFDRHKSIARWTWPMWMYVSITGVVVYWLLYQKYPQQ
jgi:uncharacterized membrane protein YozB (DUF420 family)